MPELPAPPINNQINSCSALGVAGGTAGAGPCFSKRLLSVLALLTPKLPSRAELAPLRCHGVAAPEAKSDGAEHGLQETKNK